MDPKTEKTPEEKVQAHRKFVADLDREARLQEVIQLTSLGGGPVFMRKSPIMSVGKDLAESGTLVTFPGMQWRVTESPDAIAKLMGWIE